MWRPMIVGFTIGTSFCVACLQLIAFHAIYQVNTMYLMLSVAILAEAIRAFFSLRSVRSKAPWQLAREVSRA